MEKFGSEQLYSEITGTKVSIRKSHVECFNQSLNVISHLNLSFVHFLTRWISFVIEKSFGEMSSKVSGNCHLPVQEGVTLDS